jgi:hypothetical protein
VAYEACQTMQNINSKNDSWPHLWVDISFFDSEVGGLARKDCKVIQVRKGSEVMGGGCPLLHKKFPSN